MPERTTITQAVQIGVETTPGTSVPANKLLPSLMINTGLDGAFTEQRGSGNKFAINQFPGKEWAKGTISGAGSYDEITYLLASIMSFSAPVVTETTANTWTLPIASTAEDIVKTYTVEQGSAARAQKFTAAQVQELTLTGNRDAITLSGAMIGTTFTDGISMTATPTAVAQQPILPKHVSIFSDNTSAGLGATKLTRALSWELSIKNRFNPLWVVDAAQPSYVLATEQPIDGSLKLKLEADAAGMAMLTAARTGAKKFIRIQCKSDQLAGATTALYELTFDVACAVKSYPSEISDQDGVYAVEWEFAIVHDTTFGKAITTKVVNKTTAL